jgi:hypothetical protein
MRWQSATMIGPDGGASTMITSVDVVVLSAGGH